MTRYEYPSAETIWKALGGVRARAGYLCRCPVPSHGKGKGDRNPSLYVQDGEKKLLVHCFAGCEAAEVLKTLSERNLSVEASEPVSARRAPPEPKTSTEDAQRLWNAAVPLEGTRAATYLAARHLPADLPSIRYLRRYKHRSTVYDAKIAALQAPDRRLVSVQLTFLHPREPKKANLARPRRIIGPSRGFALRLAPPAETLGLAEGYETGHAAMLRHGVPVWCALGVERLHTVIFPDIVRRLVLFIDPDPVGRRAVAKIREANPDRELIVVEPPVTGPDDDRDFAAFWEEDPTPDPTWIAAHLGSPSPLAGLTT